jgi:hydroxymethylpyrimidine pyrophosphatase-like HAD family hydrolase
MRSSTRGPTVSTVYTDLDGTLLGPGGSLLRSVDGPSIEAAKALIGLAEAGIDLVLVSGRTRTQVREVARLVGARAYIVELGWAVIYPHQGEEQEVRPRVTGPGDGRAIEAIHRSGAAGLLLDAFAGRLEPHAPWAVADRECSVLLRGLVDLKEARSLLAECGYQWLDLQDNGVIPAGPDRFPDLRVEQVRAYHLLPVGVSKRAAVALDRAHRDLPIGSALYVGDSVSDLEVAPEVGTVRIVANGAEALSGIPLPPNATFTRATHGAGFAEAVGALL